MTGRRAAWWPVALAGVALLLAAYAPAAPVEQALQQQEDASSTPPIVEPTPAPTATPFPTPIPGGQRIVFWQSGIWQEFVLKVPIPKLAQSSDLVVRGVPASHSFQVVETRYPLPDPSLPLRPRELDPKYRAVAVTELQVSEYLKGTGPETLLVGAARPAFYQDPSHAERTEGPFLKAKVSEALKLGQEYVLFLQYYPGDPKHWPQGAVMWLGDERLWVVRGDLAERPWDRTALGLAELRGRVAAAGQ